MRLALIGGFQAENVLAAAGLAIAAGDDPTRVIETLPIGALLAASVMLVVWGEPALRYARDTADALHNPQRYIRAVMSARPLPPPSMPGDASARATPVEPTGGQP